MMLLKKIHPSAIIKTVKKKKEEISHLITYIKSLEENIKNSNKEIESLKEKIKLLELYNKHIVADTVMLAQSLTTIYTVVSEHNEIINNTDNIKKIVYH